MSKSMGQCATSVKTSHDMTNIKVHKTVKVSKRKEVARREVRAFVVHLPYAWASG